MTFIVNVPENTPNGDIINILYNIPDPTGKYPFITIEKQMEKIDEFTYSVDLDLEEIDVWGEDLFEYIYNRNAWTDSTTEFLPLEPEDRDPENQFEYRNAKRRVEFKEREIIEDTVLRWRWFPEGSVKYTSNIVPQGEFKPRIDGELFRSGQGIQDLYIKGFEKFYNSTAEHMAEMGYRWVAFYPPWQWIDDNPPKTGNGLELGLTEDPNYPSDEALKEQIKAYRSKGLKIFLAPQICCNSIDTEDRSSEWWENYMDEVERFNVHHAKIAEDAGAEMYQLHVPVVDKEKIPNYNERMREMVSEIRKVYSEEIGIQIWSFLWQVEKPEATIPEAESIPWASDFDIIFYSAEGELSPKDNPKEEELKEGAGHILDLSKEFYDKYDTPIVVTIAPFSIKHAWKGPSFYNKGKIPSESEAEDAWEFHSYSAEDQARVDNAYLEAAAERPWVIGMMHFGYWQWEMPMLPGWSVREKQAEDVWRKWNDKIYGND